MTGDGHRTSSWGWRGSTGERGDGGTVKPVSGRRSTQGHSSELRYSGQRTRAPTPDATSHGFKHPGSTCV